ncbi:MAG: RnfABCDGE type electron transport complex subunit G [Spirochaetaceae bacterium]|jgi:electron transport complex protein RnfG|nr:RnfABCDGE type electron transport complex subunit G [Spirochaetaceae bacterium]
MKDTIKMVAALVIFATVACVALAFVYDATSPVIAENNVKKTLLAQKELFPDAEFEEIKGEIVSFNAAVEFGAVYTAKKNGKITGVIINSSSGGFNAPISALVGVSSEGKITGVQIITNTDTPGLGSNASNPAYFIDKPAKTKTFYGQFTGMSVDDKVTVEKDGGKVVAITAATISSRAVALLVSEALTQGTQWLAQNGGSK